MSVVGRIKQLCKENKITIAELERLAGIGNGVIRRWDDRAPASDKLANVASYFSVSTDYLLGLTDQRRPGEIAAASADTPYDQLPPEALRQLEEYKRFLIEKYRKEKE